ncbi:MAG TPA: SRPBCC family protein [Solirubrobacteraceae bacterium]|nr:SRPBCC family protein [Solirubrobacteraceae bacterium]
MQRVHVVQDFPQPVEEIFGYLSEHENLGPLFGAKIKRLNDGTDGTRNGTGGARQLRVGPLPSFVETNVEVIPNELIRYRITQGGILKDHEGVMRFSRQGGGSRVDYTINFEGKLPGIGPAVKSILTRGISKGLSQLAENGTAAAR